MSTVTTDWVKIEEHPFNKETVSECWMKYYTLPGGKKVPVYLWRSQTWHYTVSAGANSDYSYTGAFEVEPSSAQQAIRMIDTIKVIR